MMYKRNSIKMVYNMQKEKRINLKMQYRQISSEYDKHTTATTT